MTDTGILELIPISTLEPYERIILYPAASGVVYFMEFLRAHSPHLTQKIIALSDKDSNKHNLKQEGITVIPPADIPGIAPDALVICSPIMMDSLNEHFKNDVGLQCPIYCADHFAEYINTESDLSALVQLSKKREGIDISRLADFPTWFLSMPFGDGKYVKSSKGALTFRMLDQIKLPTDLTGKDILDLGAFDGFYSFECKARGANRVVSVEDHSWSTSIGFEKYKFSQDFFGLETETSQSNVNEDDLDHLGTFDIVLCMGLYYHLRDPFRVFRKLRAITRERMIITGVTITAPVIDPIHKTAQQASYMMMSDKEFGKWTANIPCLIDMLKIAGFSSVEVVFNLCPEGSYIASTVLHAIV